MNIQCPARVRGISNLALRIFVAVASVFGFCGLTECRHALQVVQSIPLNVTVVAAATGLDEASLDELSTSRLITVTYPPKTLDTTSGRTSVVTNVSISGEDGRSFEGFTSEAQSSGKFDVMIDPNAIPPSQPLIISIERRSYFDHVLTEIESGSARLFLRAADGLAAPGLTRVLAVDRAGRSQGSRWRWSSRA